MRRGILARRALWGGLALSVWLAAAPAGSEAEAYEGEEDAGEESVVPLGEATRAWLDRQRSGVDESRNPHGLTAPEEHRARTRYLESFTHPIPPLFELDDPLGADE